MVAMVPMRQLSTRETLLGFKAFASLELNR